MYCWFDRLWILEKRCIKMRFIRVSVRAKEHRGAASATKSTRVSKATFIANRLVLQKCPSTVLLAYPSGERGSSCSSAALAMTMTYPVRGTDQHKSGCATKTMTCQFCLFFLMQCVLTFAKHCDAKRHRFKMTHLPATVNLGSLADFDQVNKDRLNPRVSPLASSPV